MTQTPNSYVLRLQQCENRLDAYLESSARQESELKLIRRDMAIITPLAEWAIKTIMTEQEANLALDKRLGIK